MNDSGSGPKFSLLLGCEPLQTLSWDKYRTCDMHLVLDDDKKSTPGKSELAQLSLQHPPNIQFLSLAKKVLPYRIHVRQGCSFTKKCHNLREVKASSTSTNTIPPPKCKIPDINQQTELSLHTTQESDTQVPRPHKYRDIQCNSL